MAQLSATEVNIPGIDEEMRTSIGEIIADFEDKHESDLANDGDGWVPRIELVDYIIAGVVNLILIIWLIASFT
jgi:hypothetical protein